MKIISLLLAVWLLTSALYAEDVTAQKSSNPAGTAGSITVFNQLPDIKAGSPWSGNALEMNFRWCPPGTFLMGSAPDEFRGEGLAQVRVTLTQGFWMGETEVTQKQWQSLMESALKDQRAKVQAVLTEAGPTFDPMNIRRMIPRIAPDPVKVGKGNRYPMYFVNWHEATAFCEKLTKRDHGSGKIPADWKYALPTDAQWEYACRAGTKTATAFGDTLSSHQANFDGDRPYSNISDVDLEERAPRGPDRKCALAVATFRPNAWGLYDMHGNVSEWCRDWYDEKKLPGGKDPEIKDGGFLRVRRGGWWGSSGAGCLSAYRNYNAPHNRQSWIGFRVALVQIPQTPQRGK